MILEQLLAFVGALSSIGVEPAHWQRLNAQVLDDTGGAGLASLGAVSNLIAATLQTAGVYAQASILQNFKTALISIAALCYLCSVLAAVFSVTLHGTYKNALYLLIGPTLFYFCIENTDSLDGTRVQVGGRIVQGSVADQKAFMQKFVTAKAYDQDAQVSSVFLIVDALVSDIVQKIVEVLSNAKNKEDMVAKARERVFSWVILSTPSDPAFLKLISLGMNGECSQVKNIALELPTYRIDPTKGIEDANLSPEGKKRKADYDAAKKLVRFTLDPETQMFAYKGQDPTKVVPVRFSCEMLWQLGWSKVIEYSKSQLTEEKFLAQGPRDPNVPWQKAVDEAKKALALQEGGKNVSAEQMLAAIVLRNINAKTPHAAMSSAVNEHAQFNAARKTYITDDIARAESYAGFLRIQYFAAAIPYIQGVLLYLLSCSFPFFAVFLVMPSRAHSFFIWMSLWIWVKSWDIGFAFVSIARRIMWTWVRHGHNRYLQEINWENPESVFSIIMDNDPFATPTTYYQIVGLMTVSVPLLTAHCCLGATNLYDAFKMSIDQTANRFGQQRSNWTKREVASRAEREYKEAVHAFAMSQVKKAEQSMNQGKGFFSLNGEDLRNRGDGSEAELLAQVYMTAAVQYKWSDAGIQRAARLGGSTGRVVSQTNGTGKILLDAYVRGMNMSFQGQDSAFRAVGDPNATGGGDYLNGIPDPSDPNKFLVNPGSTRPALDIKPPDKSANVTPIEKE